MYAKNQQFSKGRPNTSMDWYSFKRILLREKITPTELPKKRQTISKIKWLWD